MKYSAIIKNLQGVAYPLFASIKHTSELNGSEMIELQIHQNKPNKRFIDDLTEMWQIDFNQVTYSITKLKQITQGKSYYWEVQALPVFYEDMEKVRMYSTQDISLTGVEFFRKLEVEFEKLYPNKPEYWYKFNLIDAVSSQYWQGFGKGEDLLTIFKKGLERYDLEFYISGNIVYLKKMIGRDTQFQYRYKLNASNLMKEIDANNFYTYARGYGDLPDDYKDFDKEAKLKTEYISPLENIPGMKRKQAPPIVDGRIKKIDTMQASLKTLVDESLKISITASIMDLRNNGYPYAQPEKGDRINLIDERIELNTYIRAVKIVTEYNGYKKVKDIQVTFGSPSLRERHQNKLNGGIAMITALLEGNLKLPYSILDDAVKLATSMLLNANTELQFTELGILAINKENPNLVVLFNSAGIGISNDGGKTFGNALTGAGLVADAITTGTLNTNNIKIVGTEADKYITIDGSRLTQYGTFTRTWRKVTTTSEVRTILEKGHARFRNDTLNRSIYISDYGISTALDGTGDYADFDGASGTLQFFDPFYSPSGVNGVTLNSAGGVAALSSDKNRVVIDSYTSTLIKSKTASVYITPMTDTRSGLNEFQFFVKLNESSAETDGVLAYGNLTGGATHGCGIRFEKSNKSSIVYATNNNGDIGTGHFYADKLYGDLTAKVDNAYALVNNEFRVTDKKGYNNGSPVYKDIRFQNWTAMSHEDAKKDIQEWTENVLNLYRDLQLHTYRFNHDENDAPLRRGIIVRNDQEKDLFPKYWRSGDGFNGNEIMFSNAKAIQDIIKEIDNLKEVLKIG